MTPLRIDNGRDRDRASILNNSSVPAAGTTAHNNENVPTPGTSRGTHYREVRTKKTITETITFSRKVSYEQVFHEATTNVTDTVMEDSGVHAASTMNPAPGILELGQEEEEEEQVAEAEDAVELVDSNPSSSTRNLSNRERRAAAIVRAQGAMAEDAAKVKNIAKKRAAAAKATTATTATVTTRAAKLKVEQNLANKKATPAKAAAGKPKPKGNPKNKKAAHAKAATTTTGYTNLSKEEMLVVAKLRAKAGTTTTATGFTNLSKNEMRVVANFRAQKAMAEDKRKVEKTLANKAAAEAAAEE